MYSITIEAGEFSAVNLSSTALLAARMLGLVPKQQE